jgi:hypothetical protein
MIALMPDYIPRVNERSGFCQHRLKLRQRKRIQHIALFQPSAPRRQNAVPHVQKVFGVVGVCRDDEPAAFCLRCPEKNVIQIQPLRAGIQFQRDVVPGRIGSHSLEIIGIPIRCINIRPVGCPITRTYGLEIAASSRSVISDDSRFMLL